MVADQIFAAINILFTDSGRTMPRAVVVGLRPALGQPLLSVVAKVAGTSSAR
jgi:hypothetical protein